MKGKPIKVGEAEVSIVKSTLSAIVVAGLAGLPAASPAAAGEGEITFCNEFPHMVYIAIAYEQSPGFYLSRGWLSLNTGECSPFDAAIRVKTFYYRGKSVPYREGKHTVKTTWGGDKDFAIWERDNFQYYGAQKRVLNSSLESFSKGPESTEEGLTTTITFLADGRTMTTIPGPSKADALESDPDYQKCRDSSGDEAITACDRAIGSGKFSGKLLAILHVNRGVERGNKSDSEGALSDYDEAIQLNPSNSAALNNRGVVYIEKGEYDRAIQDLDQAINLKPDYSRAFRNRGDAYRKKGDRDHAVADYQKALSFSPEEALRKEIEAALDDLGAGTGTRAPSPSGSPTTGKSLPN